MVVKLLDILSLCTKMRDFSASCQSSQFGKQLSLGVRCAAFNLINTATGYIRRAVGKNLKLRMTPAIKFVADDSVEYGFELFKKLGETNKHVDGESHED